MDTLEQALAICEQHNIHWKKWQILSLLARIAESEDQRELAASMKKRAGDTIEWIFAQIESDEIKKSFLRRTELKIIF